MKTMNRIRTPIALAVVTAALLSGCESPAWVKSFTQSPPSWLTPYRTDIGQGNYITQAMAERLQKGMSKDQVRAVLGTPLLVDPFRANRWDYVFEIRKGDGTKERRRFWVNFENDVLAGWEGDPLPSQTSQDVSSTKPSR